MSLVYGEADTGKTTLAIQCAVNLARSGKRTIYIDSDRSLSSTRLSQISGYDLEVLRNIIIFTPENFDVQTQIVESLPHYVSSQVALIAVDTVTSLYRLDVGDSDKTFKLNRQLNRQLAYFSNIAKEGGVATLLLSQVRSLMMDSPEVEPVANRLLRFWSNNIVQLRATPMVGVKEAVLELRMRRKVQKKCHFRTGEAGIEDLK